MNMIFEVMDLAVASPATVSRCGMVYTDASQIGWRPIILAWLASLPPHLPEALKSHLLGLFDWLLPVSLRFLHRELPEASPTLNGNLAVSLHRTFAASARHLLDPVAFAALPEATAVLHTEALFLFALVWSVGGSVADVKSRRVFDKFLRAAISCRLHGAPLKSFPALVRHVLYCARSVLT
jgi:dynein heavy chain